jgi:hypothetical protein
MGSQESGHIFQHDHSGTPSAHFPQHVCEAPESRRLSAGQPLATASQGEVIAGKRRSRQGDFWYVVSADIVNVPKQKLSSITEVVAVHLPLVFVNIISKGYLPASTFKADAHEAYASKELRKCLF